MWGADFPHHEGTTPYSREAIRANFATLPEPEVRRMLALNAAECYGFDLDELQDVSDIRIPEEHVEFLRSLPYFHEDEQAIYVHAGLIPGESPANTDPDVLLWTRDFDFFRGYDGKLCFFGHTPTHYLPKDGRTRRFGIYIHGGCVGIDTSGDSESPLSCIEVENFALYQAHPSGLVEVERLRSRKPAALPAKAAL